jgi:allantoate deiminase
MARADELAACTERPGEVTRRYGTPALVAGRDLLEAWMLEAGMRTRVDRVGNLIGSLGAGEQPCIVIGSHFDTVVDAGRYDGTLGVLLGIGCAEELAGADPAHDLTVVAFCDEEGARFPTDYFGSRAFLGRPLPDGAMTDADGATLASGIEVAGNAAAEPGSGLPANAAAYLEAHIEQGPVLEAAGHPLGIVTSITGGAKLVATLTGTAGHAGTVTPAPCRCACAATRSPRRPRSRSPPRPWPATTARPWRRSGRWPCPPALPTSSPAGRRSASTCAIRTMPAVPACWRGCARPSRRSPTGAAWTRRSR